MTDQNGHAFICYVREDSSYADFVAQLLTDAGIPIWRDTENLWPGEDWRERIRDAITGGAFAFVPIFSSTSVSKGVSGQNEELYLAAEEMRRRSPDSAWMFPLRFDDCQLPRLQLGGGRTLDSIQRADLFGPEASRQAERLVGAVRRILTPTQSLPSQTSDRDSASSGTEGATPTAQRRDRELKAALRDPAGDIRLHDLLVPLADALNDGLADLTRYPTEGTATVFDIVDQMDRYWTDLDGALDVMVTAGLWSRPEHDRTWTEFLERAVRSSDKPQGNIARISARWLPLVALVHGTGIAAVHRSNYSLLRAVLVDATVRRHQDRVPTAVQAEAWTPFGDFPLVAQVLALQASGEVVDDEVVQALTDRRRGHRFTPASDYLHDKLRERFRTHVPDDDVYSDAFDRLEILIELTIADLHLLRKSPAGSPWNWYVGPPAPGRYSWRQRYAEDNQLVERRLQNELHSQGPQWEPLQAGFFGGTVERAQAAFDLLLPIADRARQNRW